ncbi:MAG: hydantoinase/oxoprolinase family protein [Alphaproteobacteria bacterium]
MLKVGIDVGGTFTDIVVQDDAGRIEQGKVPSVPGNESQAVINALSLMADRAKRPLPEFLGDVAVINFGTTVATNAMLQHRGVPTAMLTTKGFRDIVELRRGFKEVLFDIRLQAPLPVVPRRWRLVAAERIGPDGDVIEPLNEADVRAAALDIKRGGIRAVAVCFLNSYVNPAHERRAAEIIAAECAGVDVHLSSEVLPKVREFERFSTATVNAFISPLLNHYLDRLMAELRRNGFRNQLLVMQSNGGTASPEQAGRLGCAALLSGPAGGVAAAVRIGDVCGARNVIGVDMGGTSYDVSLVRDLAPETRTESWFSRHFVGLPMLAIHTIGAGGGSIAWVDGGGALRVGPQSAGARPGPACYDTGGTDATVTDAFLYLGYLNPDFFLGGRMAIKPALSAGAIRKNVAEPFGMSLDEAAFSIYRIINNNLSNGIRYVSVAEGHDPRDFALMSFGGAGSVTVGVQARDLGIRRALVPRTASVFCALGELMADLRVSQIHATPGRLDTIDPAALEKSLASLAAGARREIQAVDGVERIRLERHAEMRYVGQVHELPTPMAENGDLRAAMTETVRRFHALHKQRYAFDMPQKPVEMLSVRQDVIGSRHWAVPRHEMVADADASSAIKARRKVCFPDGRDFAWLDTPIYDGARLRPGHRIVGPAIIEEVDTTIAIQPGDRALLNEYQVYDIAIGDAL